MNRKEKPIVHRVFNTACAFALIGFSLNVFFSGLDIISGIIIGLAVAGLATPVAIDGGGILEVLSGMAEAFLEGLLGVFDAIAGIFNF